MHYLMIHVCAFFTVRRLAQARLREQLLDTSKLIFGQAASTPRAQQREDIGSQEIVADIESGRGAGRELASERSVAVAGHSSRPCATHAAVGLIALAAFDLPRLEG